MRQVEVGRITSVHGLTGQVRVAMASDVPDRFDPGRQVYIQGQAYRIASLTPFRPGHVILSFQGVNAVEEARRLVGENVIVPASESPQLPEGEFFHYQLLGLRVFTGDGEFLGEISEILETGSNDVYVVKGDGGEVLVPALSKVITQVNLDQGMMLVSLPEGLR